MLRKSHIIKELARKARLVTIEEERRLVGSTLFDLPQHHCLKQLAGPQVLLVHKVRR